MSVRDAARAMRALIDDPEDTAQVFRLIKSLSGNTSGRIARRMRRSHSGRRLLAEKPNIIDKLCDREGLAELPANSLGRGYLEFCQQEGITAEGLVDASERGYAQSPEEHVEEEDASWVAQRMRDAHDLWHVATGYHGDIIGEASLLAFTFAQTYNRGVGLIVAVALLKAPEAEIRRTILDGFRRGRRAVWLPEVSWEALLDEPLDTVRDWLAIGSPPVYEPVRSHELV